MRMTLRWFGQEEDSVKLDQIRQIPGVEGVISALHHIPAGEVWPLEEIIKLLGSRIGHLHLNNNDGKKDSHRGFNSGNIDVTETLELIDKYCNNPSMTIEVSDFKEAEESISIIMKRNNK